MSEKAGTCMRINNKCGFDVIIFCVYFVALSHKIGKYGG
jgi:hypothetical protein